MILRCRQMKGRWEGPEVAPFSGGAVVMDAEPALTPDGQRLFFLSTRPMDGSGMLFQGATRLRHWA